ncbi:MAG: hypothetical protein WAX77_03545 [Methylococcaceae bacterium]
MQRNVFIIIPLFPRAAWEYSYTAPAVCNLDMTRRVLKAFPRNAWERE